MKENEDKVKCIMKGCNNPRFKDKLMCEKHWKKRRKNRTYKEDWKQKHPDKFIGYSDCGCNKGLKSGIVLDPFAGIGTTLLTAWKLGRNFIGFEISKKYCKIANKKLDICKNKRLDDFIFPEIEDKNPTLMDFIEV